MAERPEKEELSASRKPILESARSFWAKQPPRTRLIYAAGGAAALVVLIVVLVIVLASGGGDNSQPVADPTSTVPPDGGSATSTPAVSNPTPVPTPPPNLVEGLRLTSETDTGRSDRDGITSVTSPTLLVDASGAASVEILFNGSLLETLEGGDQVEFTFPEALREGVYGIEVRLLDSSGAELRVVGPLLVTIDTSAPKAPRQLRLTDDTDLGISQSDGLTSTASPAIRGASGADDTVRVLIDGSAAGESVSSGEGQWRVALSGLGEGVHTVTAVSEDAAGNPGGESAPYSFTLDLTPPAVSVSQPPAGANLSGGESLSGTTTDSGSGVVGVDYRFGDGSPSPVFADRSSGSFSGRLIISSAQNGSQALVVAAFDAAGNVQEELRNVSVDVLDPFVVAKTRPVSGSGEVGATVKPEISFSRAVNPSTVTNQSLRMSAGGKNIAANVVTRSDGMLAWLFPAEPLPGSSTVTVSINGDLIRSASDGVSLDADLDGAPGGELNFTYSTVSLQSAFNTTLSGVIADPGPDGNPMTADDLSPGPDGVLGTRDDVALLPIPGVEVSLLGVPGSEVVTGSDGSYLLDSVPVGTVKVKLDGLTGTAPNGFYFPEMVMSTKVRPGEDNDIMPGHRIAFLPRLPNEILRTVNASQTAMIVGDGMSAPALPPEQRSLLSIEIQPNSLLAADGSSISSAQIGISTVAPELVMDMLPPGVLQHTFDITIQAPGVANFSTPAPMSFPNVFDSPPGTKLNFLSFNHDTGLLEIEGTATVSTDGKSVKTDPGTGIIRAGWHGLTRPGSIVLPGCDPSEEPTVDVDPNPFITRERTVTRSGLLIDERENEGTNLFEQLANAEKRFRKIHVDLDDELWTPEDVAAGTRTSEYVVLVENRDENGVARIRNANSSCGKTEQTPLMVEVIVIGPTTEFMDTVTNAARPSEFEQRILRSEDPTADEAELIFGVLLSPGEARTIRFVPNQIVANPTFPFQVKNDEESLFGAKVQIRAFKWGEPETLLIDETFRLYSWSDVGDSKEQDGFASMPDATVDGPGGGKTRRPVRLRMPEPVTFESSSDVFKFETGEFTGFVFDPVEVKNDQLGSITVISPSGQKTGTIPVEGDGIIVDVWINDQGFIKVLEDTFLNVPFTDLRDEGLKNHIDTPEKRSRLFVDVFEETVARLDPLITAGPDGTKGTRDDGGIRFANVSAPGRTLDITTWTGPPNPLSPEVGTNRLVLGNATEVDWSRPVTPIELIKKTLDRNVPAQNSQRAAFELVEAVNVRDDGDIRIYMDRWIRLIDRDLIQRQILETQKPPDQRRTYPDPRQALVEGLASTIAHEIGHAVGLVHTSTNFNPISLEADATTKEIRDPGADQDIMAQGADFVGELTYPVTEGMYKMAIGQLTNGREQLDARKYWARYVSAMARFARRDNQPIPQPFNIDGGGTDGVLPVLDFVGRGVAFLIADPDTDPDLAEVIDFGTVPAGPGSSVARTLGLFNIGDRALAINRVAIEPGSSSSFDVSNIAAGTVLRPGESLELLVTFSPVLGGFTTGGLLIETDEPSGGFTAGLTGVGQRQEPDLAVRVINNNLGGAVAMSESIESQLAGVLENIGSQPVTITAIGISASDSPFALGSISLPTTLQTGQSLDVMASFTPATTGLQRASVVITSNDPDTPQALLRLSGTGTAEFPGALVDYGDDFIALETPLSDLSPILRDRTDGAGNYEFFLPPETLATFVTFDPVSGLVSAGGTRTAPAGDDTVMPTVPFRASNEPDFDNDGVPADIEFAIGSSDANVDSDGDGIDDFTALLLGLDPLGALALPTGIVSQLMLAGDATAVAIGSSARNPDVILAYVATGSAGFASVDISSPLEPVILSELDLPGENSDIALDLGNGRVYVAAGQAGIHVIDVSDPTNPSLVQSISTTVRPTALVLTELGLFAVGGRSLLAIDLQLGEVVGNLEISAATQTAIAAEGDHIFVLDGSGGLTSVDVSQVFLTGQMSISGSITAHKSHRMTVLDGIAYLAGDGSYSTCDVSDPTDIQLIADVASGVTKNFGQELVPGGSGVGALIYSLFGREPTVLVMDISDPNRTDRLLTRFDLPANPLDATFAAGLVVIADGTEGLVIVNHQPIDAAGVAPAGLLSVGSADKDAGTPGVQLIEGSVGRFEVDATDDVQVRTVELLRDGVVIQSDASFPFELFARLPALSLVNQATFRARITDTGGNSSLTGTVEVLLLPDVQGPTLVSIDPNDRGFTPAGSVQLEALFSEVLAIDTVTASNLRLSGPGGSTVNPSDIEVIDGGRRVRLSYSSLQAGVHTLTINSSAVTDVGGTPAGTDPVETTFEVINDTNHWINPTGGSWSDAGNWSAGRIPDATDTVVISLPGTVTVNHGGLGATDAVARQLYIDDRLEVTSGRVLIEQHGAISGAAVFGQNTILVSEGTFELRGQMTTNPLFRTRVGAIFENTGRLIGLSGAPRFTEGVFENLGLVRVQSFVLGGEGVATFNNREAGVIELISDGQFTDDGVNTQLNNFGLIRSDGADGLFGGILNAGVIEVASGEFRVQGGENFTSDGGTIRVAAGATLTLNAQLSEAMRFEGDSRFEGAGSVDDGTDFDITSGSTLTIDMPNGFKLSGNGVMFGSGGVINLQKFVWETGKLALAGGFENQGLIEIKDMPAVPVELDGDLDNFGSIHHITDKELEIDNATLRNMPNAVYDFQSDGDIDSQDNNNSHFFINDGFLFKSGGTGINDIDAVLTNTQPISVASGAIRVRRKTTFTDTVVTVVGGAEFRISSGDHTFNGVFEVNGPGRVLIGNTGTTYNVSSGTNIKLNTQEGISLLQGEWVGGGSLTLLRNSTYSGGTLALTGGVVNSEGMTMTVNGTGNKTFRNTTFSNQGIIRQETTVNILMENTALVNASTGAIEIRGSGGFDLTGSGTPSISNLGLFQKISSGNSTVDVALTNDGTIEILAGTLIASRGYIQNSGTTALNGGNLSVQSGGTVMLNGGLLTGSGTITGSVQNAGTIEVGGAGTAGTLTLTVRYTQLSTGTLVIELGGTGGGASDQLKVNTTGSNAVTLDGTLEIKLIGGFNPVENDSFVIVDYNNVTGTFAFVDPPTLAGGLNLNVVVGSSDTTATVVN